MAKVKKVKVVWAVMAATALFLVPMTGCDSVVEREGERAPGGRGREGEVLDKGGSQAVQLNWIGHWKGEDKREDLVLEIKKEFEFTHPDVRINLVFNKDMEGEAVDYKERTADVIVKMIETGEIGWDAVFLDVAIYDMVADTLKDPYWVGKHMVDFADVPGFVESQKDFIVQDPRYRNKVGGIFTGPFVESYIMSVWFNSRVAGRAGIEVKERDMTFDDFLGYAERLEEYNRSNDSSIPFIKLCSWNRIDFLFESLFKSQFDDFDSAVEEVFTEEKRRAFLETLSAFEELSRHQPVVNRDWEKVSSNDFQRDYLLNDDALFVMGGTFMYSQFRGIDPEESRKMRPAENPFIKNPNGLIGDYTPVFGVMKNSRNRDLAVELVMSWARPKNAEKWVRYTKNLTGTRGNLSEAAPRELSAANDVYERFILDMEQKYAGVPMMYMRTPTYVFGKRNPVSVLELRLKLAEILEGKLKAREYYEDVMARMERND
jgi:ABC-type glycerol-3-phosphate transport system substrate-binding protein